MTKSVECYGIHWADDVAFLMQGRGATNFAGLKATAPFQVDNSHQVRFCNHLVPTAAPLPDRVHWDAFAPMMKDPLVRAMLPVPKPSGDAGLHLVDPDGELDLPLVLLSKLGSPIHRVVQPFASMRPETVRRELTATNILPLVLTGATREDAEALATIVQSAAASPRRLVVTGSGDVDVPGPMKRIDTRIGEMPIIDLAQLPMEILGAAIIRRYCRREQLDAPMESRDARRERILRERKNEQGLN